MQWGEWVLPDLLPCSNSFLQHRMLKSLSYRFEMLPVFVTKLHMQLSLYTGVFFFFILWCGLSACPQQGPHCCHYPSSMFYNIWSRPRQEHACDFHKRPAGDVTEQKTKPQNPSGPNIQVMWPPGLLMHTLRLPWGPQLLPSVGRGHLWVSLGEGCLPGRSSCSVSELGSLGSACR